MKKWKILLFLDNINYSISSVFSEINNELQIPWNMKKTTILHSNIIKKFWKLLSWAIKTQKKRLFSIIFTL